jgi:hypothetical protein
LQKERASVCDGILQFFQGIAFLEHIGKRRVNVTRSGFHVVYAQEHASHLSAGSWYQHEPNEGEVDK